ncbi:hypothetical protein BCR41DRAFT_403550, partial [Lobosporangium transversale]
TTDQKKRSFRELALEASEQSHGSQTEKKKALLFVELLEAVPIVVKNNQGDEEVLLAHVKNWSDFLPMGPFLSPPKEHCPTIYCRCAMFQMPTFSSTRFEKYFRVHIRFNS